MYADCVLFPCNINIQLIMDLGELIMNYQTSRRGATWVYQIKFLVKIL